MIAFFVVTTVIWVRRDSIPPLWDQAHYLQESELLYHTLRQQGPAAFLSAFSGVMGSKAPLITALPLPLYALLGESHLSARYVNVAFIVLASFYLFRLGTIVAGRRAALLAVVLLNTFPLVAGMSRQFLVEYGLMTLVIAWMYYLVRWWQGEERWSPWALGLVLGFGMLMKVTFPLYVAAPTALVLADDVRRHRRPRSALLLGTARVAALALPIAGIWYFKNWATVFGFVVKAGYGEWAHAYGKGDVWSLRTLGAYWWDLVNFGIGGYAFLLLVILAGCAGIAAAARRGGTRPVIISGHLALLIAWWLVPWLTLSFAVSKDLRFSTPYLPALALLLGAGYAALARGRLGIAIGVLIAGLGVFSYTHYSFAAPGPAIELRPAGLLLIGKEVMWARPPTTEHWPNERIAETLAADALRLEIANPRATVLFSHPQLNAHNLNYMTTRQQSPLRFNTCSFQAPESAQALAERIRSQSDYVLTKSSSLGQPQLNTKNLEVLALLRQTGFPFLPIEAIALPDGSELTIFRRQEHGHRILKLRDYRSTHGRSPQQTARFGDGIALLDFEVKATANGVKIRLLWQCLAPMVEDYRVYLHAYGAERGMFGVADHYPNRGNYRTPRWRVGDVIEDEVWLPGPAPPGLAVFVGWYNLAERKQLPLVGPEASDAREPNGLRIY